MAKTGWPPGLLQDDDRKLSRWFASQPGARRLVDQRCDEIRREKMTDTTSAAPSLLPCPFCGTTPVLERGDAITWIVCPDDSACRHSGLAFGIKNDNIEGGIAAWNLRAPQPVAREPLSDEQIFEAARATLPGKAHELIHSTDPEYAMTFDMEPGTRWTCSEVRPEHSVAFARAIERAQGITGDKA